MAYVTFLIDAGGVIAGSVSRSPDSRQPDGPDIFKVICNGGRVTVIGQNDKLTQVIASARWRDGQLDRRTLAKKAPRLNADQWTLIRNSVAMEVGSVGPEALEAERPEATREVVSRSPLKLDQPSALFKAVVWGTMIVVLVLAFVLSYTLTKQPEPAATPVAAPVRLTPPLPPEDPIDARIARAGSFAEAIRIAKPTMTDNGMLLATYAVNKLRWEDVDVAAETTFGHVLKDSEAERGKRMCADGELVAIQRKDLGPRKIYVGLLRVTDADAISFVAVGTTGELIRGSKARFCGAVTGTAGTGVAMVGMFDLPENRTPIVEQ